MKARGFFLGALMIVAGASEVLASSLDDGIAAAKRGDYSTALSDFLPLANQGDALAQYNIGILYKDGGHGVPQDYEEARKWLTKAAEGGGDRTAVVSNASFLLGIMLESGLGGPKDPTGARKWYLAAAERGNIKAADYVAQYFEQGLGGPTDLVAARKWLLEAAQQGNADAQYHIGRYFFLGIAGPKDEDIGLDWMRKAAAQGQVQAQYTLGLHYQNLGNYDEATKWFSKAAEQGYAPAKEALQQPPNSKSVGACGICLE